MIQSGPLCLMIAKTLLLNFSLRIKIKDQMPNKLSNTLGFNRPLRVKKSKLKKEMLLKML